MTEDEENLIGITGQASYTNNDEVVDFIEAFWRENYLLTGTGQDPVLYQ